LDKSFPASLVSGLQPDALAGGLQTHLERFAKYTKTFVQVLITGLGEHTLVSAM